MWPRARATKSPRRFGAAFTTLLEQALGQGDAPISPRKPLPDYIVEKRFAEPVATEGVISATLSRLAQMLVTAMDKQGKGARRLEASFFRTDGAVRAIVVDTGQPVTRSEVIDRLFRERLDALNDPLDPGFGFDLIRLSASRTEIVVQQQRDLDANVHDNDELAALIDRIAARIGGRRVVVHLPQDTHIPERAVLAAPAQHHLAAAMQAAWPARVESEPPLRPLRLFEKPEPIKVPFATVPDGPPHHFTWRRANHAVVRVEGPERIAMEWWKQDGEALTRDYFRVEDEAGLRFWIYRDGLYGSELADEEGKPSLPTGSCMGCSHEHHSRTMPKSASPPISRSCAAARIRAPMCIRRAACVLPPSASPTTTRWPAWCGPTRNSAIPRSSTSQNF